MKNFKDINTVYWADDGLSVDYDSFQDWAMKNGFIHIFTYPHGKTPIAAIASRTLSELQERAKITPYKDLV